MFPPGLIGDGSAPNDGAGKKPGSGSEDRPHLGASLPTYENPAEELAITDGCRKLPFLGVRGNEIMRDSPAEWRRVTRDGSQDSGRTGSGCKRAAVWLFR